MREREQTCQRCVNVCKMRSPCDFFELDTEYRGATVFFPTGSWISVGGHPVGVTVNGEPVQVTEGSIHIDPQTQRPLVSDSGEWVEVSDDPQQEEESLITAEDISDAIERMREAGFSPYAPELRIGAPRRSGEAEYHRVMYEHHMRNSGRIIDDSATVTVEYPSGNVIFEEVGIVEEDDSDLAPEVRHGLDLGTPVMGDTDSVYVRTDDAVPERDDSVFTVDEEIPNIGNILRAGRGRDSVRELVRQAGLYVARRMDDALLRYVSPCIFRRDYPWESIQNGVEAFTNDYPATRPDWIGIHPEDVIPIMADPHRPVHDPITGSLTVLGGIPLMVSDRVPEGQIWLIRSPELYAVRDELRGRTTYYLDDINITDEIDWVRTAQEPQIVNEQDAELRSAQGSH